MLYQQGSQKKCCCQTPACKYMFSLWYAKQVRYLLRVLHVKTQYKSKQCSSFSSASIQRFSHVPVPCVINVKPVSHITFMMVQTTAFSPHHTMYAHMHAQKHIQKHIHKHALSLEMRYATGRRSHWVLGVYSSMLTGEYHTFSPHISGLLTHTHTRTQILFTQTRCW